MMLISGTIASTVQLQTQNSKWLQKKASGDVLTKEERNERASWTQEDWLKHDFQEQAAQSREDSKRTDITNKIMAGGTLTPEEEQYLEQNNPTALQKYREIKAEKKEYEEKLRNCKTKDEVQRVKMETMGEYLSSMKKIENNPYIPMSEKLAKAQELLAKTKNIQEAEIKFIQSPEYTQLPTEAEEAEERSKERALEDEQALEIIEDGTEENEVSQDTGNQIPQDTDNQIPQTNETKLSAAAQEYLAGLQEQYGDYEFIIDDGTDDLKSQPASGNKEFSVVFSMEELERMASDKEYGNGKLAEKLRKTERKQVTAGGGRPGQRIDFFV